MLAPVLFNIFAVMSHGFCAAFGLTVSEVKTDTRCLGTRGIPDVAATFSVEAASQVHKSAHDSVYLRRNFNNLVNPCIQTADVISKSTLSKRMVTDPMFPLS